MISGLIPYRYAKALYKFALESNHTKEVYDCMKRVVSAFSGNPKLTKVMANPFVEASDKEKLLMHAAAPDAGEDYRRFVKLVLEHKREEFFYLMALSYRDLYRKDNRISRVRIVTASDLGAAMTEKLKGVVERSFKDRKFEYTIECNPEIIGGFIIDVDSVRMDASISSELEQLRQNLIRSN